jgi:hypothetical protein
MVEKNTPWKKAVLVLRERPRERQREPAAPTMGSTDSLLEPNEAHEARTDAFCRLLSVQAILDDRAELDHYTGVKSGISLPGDYTPTESYQCRSPNSRSLSGGWSVSFSLVLGTPLRGASEKRAIGSLIHTAIANDPLHEGVKLLKQDYYNRAMEVLERAMVDDTYSDKLYILNIIGAMLSSQGRYQRALEIFNRVQNEHQVEFNGGKIPRIFGIFMELPRTFSTISGLCMACKGTIKRRWSIITSL